MSTNNSPFAGTRNDPPDAVCEMTPHQLARTKPLPLIIDIREAEEFISGHIDGARHIRRAALERRIRDVAPDPTTAIVVYCAVGNQGPLAAEQLQHAGYRNVSSLKGGLQHWLEAGGMVECPRDSSFAGTR